jgi:hypothetical protein
MNLITMLQRHQSNRLLARVPPNLKGEKLTVEEVEWIIQENQVNNKSIYSLSKKFNIARTTMQDYISRHNKFGNAGGPPGRKPFLDDISKVSCVQKIRDRQSTNLQLTQVEFHQIVMEEVILTAGNRNIAICDANAPSTSTINRFCKENNISRGNAKKSTTARINAVADVRNTLSFAVMNNLMVPMVHPYLILNSDASQFGVGFDVNEKVVVMYVDKRGDLNLKAAPNKTDSGITMFFIKWYLLISAGGICGTPVYIIADETVPKGQFRPHKVRNMGYNVGVDNFAWVVFCYSRSCNLEFYKWFNNVVLFEFICLIKETHDLEAPSKTWYQLDGEQTQIECYNDPAMIKMLEELNIVIGKPPASTTEITQPCDMGNIFKATKSKLKKINDLSVAGQTHIMNKLTVIFDLHPGIDNQHRKMAIYGLLRIQKALGEVMRPRLIEQSFEKTGIYPLNINKIFSNCTSKIDAVEYKQLLAQIDPLTEVFEQQGELFDEDYDAVGIRQGPKKSDRCISGKRSVILTDPNFIDREATIKAWKRVKKAELDARKLAKEIRDAANELANSAPTGLVLRIPRIEFVINDE